MFYTMEGTAKQFDVEFPMFPAGKFVRLYLSARTKFDSNGQVTHRSVSLDLSAASDFDPSTHHLINENAQLLLSTPEGIRILQSFMDVADLDERIAFLGQLLNQVWETSGCPHASHVLLKSIEGMPPQRVEFIATELKGLAVSAAQHRIRSRVLQRLIELCPGSQTDELVEELCGSAGMLCKHPFGNYLMQTVLEHGTPDQREKLASVITSDVIRLAKHKYACNVVRTALTHSPPERKHKLMDSLTADAKQFSSLAHHCFGSFVFRDVKIHRLEVQHP